MNTGGSNAVQFNWGFSNFISVTLLTTTGLCPSKVRGCIGFEIANQGEYQIDSILGSTMGKSKSRIRVLLIWFVLFIFI